MKNAIWNAGILAQAIGIIGKSGKVLESQIQAAAVQCIAQSIVHRNATPAAQLYDALPKGLRHDSLVAYFEKFGNLMFSNKAKKMEFFDVAKVIDGTPELDWTEEYAIKVSDFHWTNGTKKPEPKSKYDVSEELGKLLERLTKLTLDINKEVTNKDLLEKVIAVVNAHNHETYRVSTKAALTEDDKAALEEQLEDAATAKAILEAIADGNEVEIVESVA